MVSTIPIDLKGKAPMTIDEVDIPNEEILPKDPNWFNFDRDKSYF